MSQQDRRQLGKPAAGELALERRIGAGKPLAHRRRGRQRLAKAHLGEPVEGGRIIGIDREGKRVLRRRGRRRCRFEQPRIMALHGAQVPDQRVRKCIAIGKAEEAGKSRQRLGVRGQRMGLLVRHHLQAVLDRAQETIGRVEIAGRLGVDPSALRQPVQHFERRATAQIRMPAARDELLGLDEEFDLANAAAAKLEIVAFDCDVVVAAVGVNLAFHGLDIGDRRVIEIFAPDERGEIGEKRLAGEDVARASARLDERGALPVLSGALVIAQRRERRDRDLGRCRIRAQAQVDTKHVTVGGALLEQLHQAAGQADVERGRLERRIERRCRRIEQYDEIHIAGIIELERTHLAHRQHEITGSRFRLRRVGRRQAALACRDAQQKAHRGADRSVGKLGQRPGNAQDRPHPADVGERDQQGGFRLEPAQPLHDLNFVFCCRDAGCRLGEQRGKMRLRLTIEDAQQPRRIFGRKLPEER